MLSARTQRHLIPGLGALLAALLLTSLSAQGARVADIANSKHNLSANAPAPNTVKANDGTGEICVFCHTPHGANLNLTGPLWNRSQDNAVTYSVYSSSSLDAGVLDDPDGSAKLCLTCHDGTIAIGAVNNKPGSGGYDSAFDRPDPIGMAGTDAGGTMPSGQGATTGFTRRLGVDLTNDHPISVTFNDTLAGLDGELLTPSADAKQEIVVGGETLVGTRGAAGLTSKPVLPLEPTGAGNVGQVQCGTCHDPHIIDNDTNATLGESIKFLRLNRFQLVAPTATYNKDNDIICLACHDKAGWETSIHATSFDANEEYRTAAATTREFPTNDGDGDPLPVWKASCLNCHDTHTVTGSRRLLREGVDDGNGAYNPASGGARNGGDAAIEQTCFQCHRPAAESALNIANNNQVPDIYTEFTRTYRMPIATANQGSAGDRPTEEPHDIGDVAWPSTLSHPTDDTTKANAQEHAGANFVESPTKLGWNTSGLMTNRHAECTDCHNPHRLQVGTHVDPNNDGAYGDDRRGRVDGNLISNVLKGTYGVEPVSWESSNGALRSDSVDSTSFTMRPDDFQVLCGTSTGGKNCDGEVTKEYQICLRCHSNYAYNDSGMPDGDPFTGRPPLRYTPPANTNQLQNYTNQAMEFWADDGHRGERAKAVAINTALDSGASNLDDPNNNNHRSWHPVMKSTGRTESVRWGGTAGTNRWVAPWNQNVGTQTMYCSDCHNNGLTSTGTNAPGSDATGVQGPHGSNNPKLLRDTWGTNVTANSDAGIRLCLDCHNSNYRTSTGNGTTGFMHGTHVEKANGDLGMRCSMCHIAIPHGWKNKAFLANLNDIGPEVRCPSGAGWCTPGQPVPEGTVSGPVTLTLPPYYMGALLKIFNFARAGEWTENGSCGERSGEQGQGWMDNVCK